MVTSNSIDIIIALVGISYGAVLIFATFISNRLTEMFRIDTFFTRRPTPTTRKLNLAFGLFVLVSSVYSLFG